MEKINNFVEMTIVLFSVGLGISFTGRSFFTVEISNVQKQEIGGICLVPKGTIRYTRSWELAYVSYKTRVAI